LAFAQAVHLLSHLASQQKPSTQKFEVHSLFLPGVHAIPAVFLAAQVVPAQYVAPTQSVSSMHMRLHPVVVQMFGAQVSTVAALQVPRPSHVRAET